MSAIHQVMVGMSMGPATDPSWSSVVLLMHMNGANNSTTFTDQKSHAATRVGTPVISTTQSVFGGSSYLSNGTTDYLTFASSADWAFGTGDFTVEGWFYSSNVAAHGNIAGNRVAAGDTVWNMYVNASKVSFGGGTTDWLVGVTTLSTNTWYHFAVTRSGTSMKSFLNGAVEQSATSANDFSSTASLGVGAQTNGSYSFPGRLEELRITKGVARYTSAFTAPTSPFPDQ